MGRGTLYVMTGILHGPNYKTSGILSLSVLKSRVFLPLSISPHPPLDLVSFSALFSSRYCFSETDLPRYYRSTSPDPRFRHRYRHGKASLKRWMVSLSTP
jgi:hypothetical protein